MGAAPNRDSRSESPRCRGVTIEGVIPSADIAALFDMLIDERVPAWAWPELVIGFMQS